MKKQIIYISLLFATFAVLFSSCMQEPIFSAIEAEIKLEEAIVSGNIYSIVESGNYLYVANGKIFRKNKTVIRDWGEISKQPEGMIIGLATGRSSSGIDYLYALSSSEKSSSTIKDYTLYGCVVGSDSWQKIITPANLSLQTLICNNAKEDINKKAYLITSSDNAVWPLNGLTVEASLSGQSNKTVKAAYLSLTDTTHFYANKAFTSNQKNTLYKADLSNIISYSQDNGITWIPVNISDITSVFDLAYDSVQNKLIIGQSNGFFVVSLTDDGKPISPRLTIGTNSDATIGSNSVITIFASQGYYYASTIVKDNSKNNGLWGYYGAYRNNEWNKE